MHRGDGFKQGSLRYNPGLRREGTQEIPSKVSRQAFYHRDAYRIIQLHTGPQRPRERQAGRHQGAYNLPHSLCLVPGAETTEDTFRTTSLSANENTVSVGCVYSWGCESESSGLNRDPTTMSTLGSPGI